MKTLKTIFILLLIFGLLGSLAGCSSANKEQIVVGSKDFPEQDILGQMLRLMIESNTDFSVVLLDNMATHVIWAAVKTGAIDVYVDYSGTFYGNYLNLTEHKSAEEVLEISRALMMERYDLKVLEPFGFNNTYCLAVRHDTAEQYGLKTFSDLAEVSSNLIFGGSAELINRSDGLTNLKITYDMSFKEVVVLHLDQRYTAIANNEIQVTEAFSTDALLTEYTLVVLEDDKNYFPPYQGVVTIRNEIAEKHPVLVEVLSLLSGLISDDTMRDLNYKVEVLGQAPSEVAENFLREQNLIR